MIIILLLWVLFVGIMHSKSPFQWVIYFLIVNSPFCMAKSIPFSSIHNPCRCSVAETLQPFWQFVTVHFVVILEFIEDLSSIGLRSTWLTADTTQKKVVYI